MPKLETGKGLKIYRTRKLIFNFFFIYRPYKIKKLKNSLLLCGKEEMLNSFLKKIEKYSPWKRKARVIMQFRQLDIVFQPTVLRKIYTFIRRNSPHLLYSGRTKRFNIFCSPAFTNTPCFGS